MTHTRRNPSQLVDPKVSVVIPVYDEKNTICEILRRVEEADMRKEIVVVDDCSKDGTREILQGLAERQSRGESQAPASDGEDPIELRNVRFFYQGQNQGKGAALRRGFAVEQETLCWCRMRTWNTTPATIRNCWNQSWKG